MPDGNIRSDAILNCPACMVTVCIDCQRYITLIFLFCFSEVVPVRISLGLECAYSRTVLGSIAY